MDKETHICGQETYPEVQFAATQVTMYGTL